MNIFLSAGMVFGVILGLIICVILFKLANSDKKVVSSYDERQEAIRGKGYKYGFYTTMLLEVLAIALEAGNFEFPFGRHLVHFFMILAGMGVLCIYCIWRGAYWGLNNNRKAYAAIFVFMVALNVFPLVMALRHSGLSADGADSLPVFNLMVLVWLGIIGISALIRKALDAGKEDE